MCNKLLPAQKSVTLILGLFCNMWVPGVRRSRLDFLGSDTRTPYLSHTSGSSETGAAVILLDPGEKTHFTHPQQHHVGKSRWETHPTPEHTGWEGRQHLLSNGLDSRRWSLRWAELSLQN